MVLTLVIEAIINHGFFVLMAYQLLWLISCQNHPCGRIAELIFKP